MSDRNHNFCLFCFKLEELIKEVLDNDFLSDAEVVGVLEFSKSEILQKSHSMTKDLAMNRENFEKGFIG